jgi:hypothetical protein
MTKPAATPLHRAIGSETPSWFFSLENNKMEMEHYLSLFCFSIHVVPNLK